MEGRDQIRPVACILLSGGIDSAACAAFYLDAGYSVRALFVNYGQLAAEQEARSAKAISRHFDIPLAMVTWTGIVKRQVGLVQGRNAFLLFGAWMESSENEAILAIGVHAGTSYADCSVAFVHEMQAVFDIYTHGAIRIGAPFVTWTKDEVWDFGKSRGVPIGLTYSCEQGRIPPCGECLSCRDLEALHARA